MASQKQWLHQDECVGLREASPPSRVSTHVAGDSGQQVAWQLFTIPIFLFNTKSKSNYSYCESLSMSIVLSSNKLLNLLSIVTLGHILLLFFF